MVERAIWNALVAGFPDGALEQGYEWAEVLRHARARPSRYAVFDDDRCVAAATILAWGLPGLPLSVLYSPRGPLVLVDHEAAWTGLAAAISDVAAATRAVFLRVSPAVFAERRDVHAQLVRHGFRHLPEDWTVWNAPKIVMTLGLEGRVDDAWRRISNTRRREIRLAARAGITIHPVASTEDLAMFYALLGRTGREKKFPVRPPAHFNALFEQYGATPAGLFVLAQHQGSVVGGLMAARLGRSAYLLYSAVDRDRTGRPAETYPGPLLYWHLIQWAQESGCTMIHWGGSTTNLPPRERDPGYGVYQFKRSFGSACRGYLGYYDLVFRPTLYAVLRVVERRLGAAAWRLRAWING